MSRQIDAGQLSEQVLDLIAGLQPGDDLVITRAGEPIATITPYDSVLEGTVMLPDAPADVPPSTAYDGVTVVATAMKLSAEARSRLSAEMGGEVAVIDMMDVVPGIEVNVLLIPAASAHAVGILRRQFPVARIVVTEIEDEELNVSYAGPVRRLLEAGADSYLASSTISHLATQLEAEVLPARRQLESGGGARYELEG
ncbi:type II toxin-antitoxin system Phd/YefM family antitoxin [Luteipulveratus mongoliensis]|uniref:type II toxin-antitoxin system Phd/YefM family antitoxin n=1 Tax=Luteipulveratus mongoliensis TaxID=571913 RepID=UPI000695BD78|nr:hypothetical protein [Luteipulveratus mongoliensis]